ncbi:FtsX-like permease family protein [Paenarthrobacter sp. DKR-5]|uniref:ABC transporter permease n=1 Tax=Paenarthrobacter sp. DKR-5 TaxID=2835535 RepID=UPI001BDBC965|nr:FtsX-like permease family protein [Paenarthrobacter sp. DKR-5]MBT1003203.1 FtsX-like permease family protein [Paenarthrobacter sp. DKR-5]
MSVLARSVGNAFRNKVRSGAVVVILAVAIGLAMSMLVANQAVGDRISALKGSVGNNLTVNPAGARGFQGGGEPLTAADVTKAKAVAHVSSVTGTLSLRLRTETATTTAQAGTQAGTAQGGPGGGDGTTSLQSAVEPGTLGNRQNQSGAQSGQGPQGAPGSGNGGNGNGTVRTFTLPVSATGVAGTEDANGNTINVTSGKQLSNFAATSTQALVGTTLAQKNNLKVGSTFTVDSTKMTVAGIFDGGTVFDNNGIYLPLAAAQKLTGQTGQISALTVKVDSIENVDSTKTSLTNALGSTRVDVTAGSRNLDSAVSSLASVQNISLIAFIAALVTAGLIVLLIMIMVVRERRREIGVLKAIGAPNRTIGLQFVLEALVLVVIGAVVGTAVAVFSSSGIASALVSANTATAGARGGRGGFGGGGFGGFGGGAQLIGNLTTTIGPGTLLGGLGAVLLIAALGALVPAWLTAKVRPIEVLRGE